MKMKTLVAIAVLAVAVGTIETLIFANTRWLQSAPWVVICILFGWVSLRVHKNY